MPTIRLPLPPTRRISPAAYLVLALLLLGQAGCFWIAAGATACGIAGYTYWRGKVTHCYLADLPDALAATRTALNEMGLPIEKEEPGDPKSMIRTRSGDGTRVKIQLAREVNPIPSEGPVTRISVRVGTFGDHPLSGRILYQISAHLVAVAQPGAPPPVAGAMPPSGPVPPPGGEVPTLPPPNVLPPQPPAAPPSWSAVRTGEPPLSR